MSRFGAAAMSDSETSTKFGVGETLAVVSLAIQLKSVFANIIKALAGKGQKDAERKTIVEALSLGLMNIEATINGIRLPKPHENTIQSYLELMMKEAKQLEERLYHHKVLQGWDVLTKGSFDSHVTKLRTGITDINSILGPYQQQATTAYPYQVGFHPHIPSASTPQVVYNHYENHTYNIYAGKGGSNDYGDVAPRLDQANPYVHPGHNSRIGYQHPYPAYPPASHR